MSTSSTQVTPEVHYPESDGQPMGETGLHVNATIELFWILKKVIFKDRPDVYVASDMFFYYEQGNPRAVKAPDVMIIKGVDGTYERRTFKLWVENQVPSVVFEITSGETRRDDSVVKLELYARLGVTEYFLFDPLREYLKPPLQGYRLEEGLYIAIDADSEGSLESRELGVKLRATGRLVHLYDLADGRLISDSGGWEAKAKLAASLEVDLTKERSLREKLQRKARSEAKKLETQRQKTEAERQKAEAERQKAEALEAEVKRLRALLAEQGPDTQ